MTPSFLDQFVEIFKTICNPTMPEWKRIQRDHSRLFYNRWARAYPHKAPPAENLLDKQRAPPARPLPLEFPNYIPPPASEPLSHERMERLRQTITRFRKPSDASDTLFAHFNIHLEKDVPLSAFVPPGQFEQRPFLFDAELSAMLNELDFDNQDAYREVLRMPTLAGRAKIRLAHSRQLFASLEDLSRYWDDTKDDYYQVPTSDPPTTGGASGSNHGINDANGSALAPPYKPVPNTGYDFMASRLVRYPPRPILGSSTTEDTASNDADDDASSTSSSTHNETEYNLVTPLPQKEVYKGYRLGNSAQTPPSTRVSAVRSLVKMVTHHFNCRDSDVNVRERLKIKDIVIPGQMVMHSFTVCRIPGDRDLQRARFVEGPLMSAYVRHDVVWKQETKERLLKEEGREKVEVGECLGEEFDLLREVGGLLVLALQRSRVEKGKKSEDWERETEGWWWAKEPRWGGGMTKWGMLASELFDDEDPSWGPEERALQLKKREKEEMEKEKLAAGARARAGAGDVRIEDLMADTLGDLKVERGDAQPLKKKSRIGLPERMRRVGERGKKAAEEKVEYKDGRRLMAVPPSKKKWYEDWKVVKPNASLWDEKIMYKATGKEEGEFDDVFQIGSVNHHVCLTKMRVSKRYLKWIEKGIVDDGKPADGDEDLLKIQRSKWFDLFDIDQRKEFLTGLWRVMSWLNRHEVTEAEFQKMEALRQQIIATGVDGYLLTGRR